jgi:ankyrin repeat protein
MDRIEGQSSEEITLAKEALSRITCAKRPLTTTELQHALALQIDQTDFDDGNKPDIEDVVSVCAGLVTIDDEGGIIRLVHYTTQQYFERTREKWFPTSELDITLVCVTYLSFAVFSSGRCDPYRDGISLEERLLVNPLYDYAAYFWGHHARQSRSLHPSIIQFLHSEKHVDSAIQAMHLKPIEPRIVRTSRGGLSRRIMKPLDNFTGLHLASYFGIADVVPVLLQHANIEAKDSYGHTLLAWAIVARNEAVVKILLKEKADIEAWDQTALMLAAKDGNEVLVALLLDVGANLEATDSRRRTPLFKAAPSGNEAVAKMLLKNGTNINMQDYRGHTPLSYAARAGREATVKLLLKAGAKVDLKDNDGWTSLSHAARQGCEPVVKMFPDAGAEFNIKDNDGRSPLRIASYASHEAIAKLLLKAGAEVETKNEVGDTPLSTATENGYEGIVNLLKLVGAKDDG